MWFRFQRDVCVANADDEVCRCCTGWERWFRSHEGRSWRPTVERLAELRQPLVDGDHGDCSAEPQRKRENVSSVPSLVCEGTFLPIDLRSLRFLEQDLKPVSSTSRLECSPTKYTVFGRMDDMINRYITLLSSTLLTDSRIIIIPSCVT